jgi:hypothetical protein
MNCTDFQRNIVLLASDHLVDASLHEQSLKHASSCDRCANQLGAEQNLYNAIRAVRAQLAAETTPLRVERTLLAAVRQQAGNTATMKLSPRPSLNVWQWGAIAAVILILVSMVVLFWQQPRSPERQLASTAPPMIPGPSSPLQPSPPLDLNKDEAPILIRHRQRTRHSIPQTAATNGETVTEFFPLIEGEDLSSLDDIRLLTVELPGSALAEVGLPMAPAAETTSVKAEVLLGQDGVARAIRFVH